MASNAQSRKKSALTYRAAGVDIDAGDLLVERIKPLAARTKREGVVGGLGGFGALFEVSKKLREPILVSGADGAGTKVKLACEWDMHEGIGQDLVAMNVNDILVQGAEPLFFLDYFACGHLSVPIAERVIAGIAKGCELAGCALIGGETAEMPGIYARGEYDLAGFAVGVAEKSALLPRAVALGDVILGLASSGAHANGFSLIRKVIAKTKQRGRALPRRLDGQTLRAALMAPTRIYVKPLLACLRGKHGAAIKALAHITGGGLIENLPRVLTKNTRAQLQRSAWPRTQLFDWLQEAGGIAESEMLRTFNCGIGMAVIVSPEAAEAVRRQLQQSGEEVFVIGEVRTGRGAPSVQVS